MGRVQFNYPVTLQATPVYKHAFLRSANKVGLFCLEVCGQPNHAGNKVPFFILASHNMLALVPFLKEVHRSLSKRFREGTTHRTGTFGLKMAVAGSYNPPEPPLFSWIFKNQ